MPEIPALGRWSQENQKSWPHLGSLAGTKVPAMQDGPAGKGIGSKPNNLSLDSATHMVERENFLFQAVPQPSHGCYDIHILINK